MKFGTLYLIPNTLGDKNDNENAEFLLSPEVITIVRSLNYFIGEEAKCARSFLKSVSHPRPISELQIELFNEHSSVDEAERLLKPALEGFNIGLLSDAGCPIVADPGAEIVRFAHKLKITVKPLAGPSSILLALMASGFSGQRFSFWGYLPREKDQRCLRIKELEALSKKQNATQLFIETPYRNEAMFDDLLSTCASETMLSLATALSTKDEQIISRPLWQWKDINYKPQKLPTVFAIHSESKK